MKYAIDSGPHIKDEDYTYNIMNRLMIALIPIILFALYKNTFLVLIQGKYSVIQALQPLFIMLSASLTSILTEKLFVYLVNRKYGYKKIESHFALFPGLFLSLVVPLNTPVLIVIIGAIFATLVGKMLFGGFGYNIFNPALIGALFIITAYGSTIASLGGYLNQLEVDTIAGATPLSNLSTLNYIGSYESIVGNYGNLYNFFFGTIPGTLGEVNKLLIILAFIYLTIFRVIKWRIPTAYVATVFIMTCIIGVNNNMGLWYPLFHIFSGGLLFGAVFMATDPVTSPINSSAQVLYGIALGILTVVLRFLTSYPEGVLTSILIMNMFVFILDRIGVKLKFDAKRLILPFSAAILIVLCTSLYISNYVKDTIKKNDKVQIINVEKSNDKTIYTVTTKGWGVIKASVEFTKDKVTKINIIDASSETQWSEIENNNYIQKLIDEQNNIEDVDTISGTTRTSKALKDMLIRVIQEYEAR